MLCEISPFTGGLFMAIYTIITRVSCLVIFAKLRNCKVKGESYLHTSRLAGEAAQICGI